MKSLAQVDHAFGGRVIFDGVSVDLPGRGVVALRGPNGCGKTTLLKLLGGILPTASREITRWREGQAAVYLDADFFTLEHLTVQEHLDMVKPLTGPLRAPQGQNSKLLTTQMMSTKVGDLSLGQRQRLVLTVALALRNVSILLLDEPLNGLDRQGAAVAREHLLRAGAERLIVVATHEEDDWTDYNLVIHGAAVTELAATGTRI